MARHGGSPQQRIVTWRLRALTGAVGLAVLSACASNSERAESAPAAGATSTCNIQNDVTGPAGGSISSFPLGSIYGLAAGVYDGEIIGAGQTDLASPQIFWTLASGAMMTAESPSLLSSVSTLTFSAGLTSMSNGETASFRFVVRDVLARVVCDETITVRAEGPGGPVEPAPRSGEHQGAGAVIADLNGGAPELIFAAYDNSGDENVFTYRVGRDVGTAGAASSWGDTISVGGVGWEGEGAGVAVASLDADPRTELILMAYDNPPEANTFRYKVGRNLNSDGVAQSWGDVVIIDGAGWGGDGAGVVVGSLDCDPRTDMILIAYDDPAEDNTFRYRVGLNLDASGRTQFWGDVVEIGGAGWGGQGAGAALGSIDADPRPDLLMMAYDDAAEDNTFRYKIGFNLNADGAAQYWSDVVVIGGLGWEGAGAGVELAFLDSDPRPELIMMALDDPDGPNAYRYKVGWNLDASGQASNWSPYPEIPVDSP